MSVKAQKKAELKNIGMRINKLSRILVRLTWAISLDFSSCSSGVMSPPSAPATGKGCNK